tara:strand:+ start:503 stop:784 length:282 start_codon:yes stop_codon:yes gene_type:complete
LILKKDILMNMEKWAKTREKGKQRFVLVNVVLGWGITTAILWSVLMEFIEPSENVWVRPIIALIIFPIAGVVFGHLMWDKSEKAYEKETRKAL